MVSQQTVSDERQTGAAAERADLDEGDDLTLDQAAQRVLARMEAQRTSLREQFNNRYLFISAGKALAGALLLALFHYGAFRAWRRVRRFSCCRSSKT